MYSLSFGVTYRSSAKRKVCRPGTYRNDLMLLCLCCIVRQAVNAHLFERDIRIIQQKSKYPLVCDGFPYYPALHQG